MVSYEPCIAEVAARLQENAAGLHPGAAGLFARMEIPWTLLGYDLLYREVRRVAEQFGRDTQDVYDDVLKAAGPAVGRPDGGDELFDGYRLRLFRTVTGWRHQRLVTAPASWPEDGQCALALEEDPDQRKVSIIVLSWNRLQYLRNCLYAFHRTAEHSNCELIVLDNGSSDGSREFLQAAVRRGLVSKLLLSRRNHGNAGGFNLGLAHADPTSSLYVKLDSDICPLTPGWVSRMVGFASTAPKVGIVALNQLNHPVLRTAVSREVAGEPVVSWSDWAVGSCMAIPRSVFEKLGYFSEPEGTTYSWDDVDYWMRVVRSGLGGYYLRDATLFHQTAFDTNLYSSPKGDRPRLEAMARDALVRHARGYDTGERSLQSFPSKYRQAGSSDPGRDSGRVVELD